MLSGLSLPCLLLGLVGVKRQAALVAGKRREESYSGMSRVGWLSRGRGQSLRVWVAKGKTSLKENVEKTVTQFQ